MASRNITFTELKVGIVITLALVVAMGTTMYVTREGGIPFFGGQYTVYSYLRDVNGLKAGAPIHLSGVQVGSVQRVAFADPGDPAPVRVTMTIVADVQDRITTSSLVTVGSLGVLGEKMLDLDPGPPGGQPIPDNGVVPGEAEGDPIKGIISDASTTMKDIRDLTRELQAGEGTIGALLKEDALHNKLTGLVDQVDQVFVSLDEQKGTFGKLIHDPAFYNNLNELSLGMKELVNRIESGDGTIGRLINDPEIGRSVSRSAENLAKATERINDGEGTLGALIRERELYDRIDALAANMSSITARLERGDGTAGQLLHDKELYENLNKTASELQGLIAAIREDPKKYLRIKVSLF